MPEPADAVARAILLQITAPTPTSRELRKRIREACAAEGAPLSVQAIHEWKGLKRGVPAARTRTVARVLGVRPSQVRPGLYSRRPPPRALGDAQCSEKTSAQNDRKTQAITGIWFCRLVRLSVLP